MPQTTDQLLELTCNRLNEIDSKLWSTEWTNETSDELESLQYESTTLHYVKDLLLYGYSRCNFIKEED